MAAEREGRTARAPASVGRSRRSVALLRLGFGGIWAANVVYVADPANDFFSSFSQVAASFGASSLGGTGVASFVAANPEFFALLIAGLTVGLAVAFLSDVAVRAACVVGAAFNIVLLATQWALVATVPGGTDVGPQPLYLVGYAAIFWGYEPGVLSLASSVRALWPRRRSHPLPSAPPVPGG